jgi:outer membrane protein assembly factor BamB
MGRSDQLGPHTTPAIRWMYTAGGPITTPAIAADGTLYIGSNDKKLHAVRPDGTARWTTTFPAAINSVPAIAADGSIYLSTADFDGKFYAVRADGTKRWSLRLSRAPVTHPIVAGDGTIITQGPGALAGARLTAIDPLTGTMIWASYAANGFFAGPAIAPDGTTYVHGPSVSAAAHDGRVKWSVVTTTYPPSSLPIVDLESNVYAGWENSLFKIAPDGTTRWTYHSTRSLGVISMQGAPAIGADGSILVPLYNDTAALVALDPMTGTVRWQINQGLHIKNSPIVDAAGWIYYVTTDNKLYGIDGNGQNPWSTPLPTAIGGVAALALGANGVLYLAGSDSKLYALSN